jgi:hypothetical protein
LILCIDETSIYFDLVPGIGVLIRTIGVEKRHASVVLAVAGSGDVLSPMIIFKGKKNLYRKAPQGLVIAV